MRSILPTFVLVGALALPVATQAQTRTITGTVTVVGSGQPLTDATISIVGGTTITALATPGHTDDGLSLAIPGAVFTGDTLLVRSCGRADFQNGDAGALYDSITRILFALPDETVVYPGHD